jgi:hypothetical protein
LRCHQCSSVDGCLTDIDRVQVLATPLHWCARGGHVALAAILLDRGANKEAKTSVRALHAPSQACSMRR